MNPPDCMEVAEPSTVTRLGDVCVTPFANNWYVAQSIGHRPSSRKCRKAESICKVPCLRLSMSNKGRLTIGHNSELSSPSTAEGNSKRTSENLPVKQRLLMTRS